jgi:hypothetical protein
LYVRVESTTNNFSIAPSHRFNERLEEQSTEPQEQAQQLERDYSRSVPIVNDHSWEKAPINLLTNVAKVLACNLDTLRERLFALTDPDSRIVVLDIAISDTLLPALNNLPSC